MGQIKCDLICWKVQVGLFVCQGPGWSEFALLCWKVQVGLLL
jgi:hypothetical protein